jgi:hypothetical protein
MESREQRIATLAATLKASGIAKSEAQAKMMAEDMVGVEEHVQKNYEEKHAAAHEYLQTAKNLGNPRQKKVEPVVTTSRPIVRPEGSRMIEPIPTRSSNVKNSDLPPVDSNLNFGGKTLNQAYSHDTHNAALEAIKAQVAVAPIVDPVVISASAFDSDIDLSNDSVDLNKSAVKEVIMRDVDDMIEAPEAPAVPDVASIDNSMDLSMRDSSAQDDSVSMESAEKLVDEAAVEIQTDSNTGSSTNEDVSAVVEEVQESPKLDAQKLVELMEEDGKLEEHTREIKEKPTNVKPKEAYEENNIDLANVFNFNKR